ncbi:MAG: YdeI/OmpD-associated family protein [Chloroflexi bacterium]|nr:YdeI/OmpD-associated family protein [Chloroflexota bacterium]
MITRKDVRVPSDFAGVLETNAQTLAAFEDMRPSCQRRYVTWIEGAKKLETRERRVSRATQMALDWKRRHETGPQKAQVVDLKQSLSS